MLLTKFFWVLLFLSLSGFSYAQEDTYHVEIKSFLQNNYGIIGGEWIFQPNEASNMENLKGFGGTYTLLEASNQDFQKVAQLTVNNVPANPWNSGMELTTTISGVSKNDCLLLIFWARTIGESEDFCLGNFQFMLRNSPYSKYLAFEQRIDTNWKQFLIPFKASADIPVGAAKFMVELGVKVQILQISGINIINYGQSYPLDSLPRLSNDQYKGMEADAPWRSAADQRIEQYRKADWGIKLLDPNNQPIPEAQVDVEMLQHDFAFGTAINEAKIAGNKNQDFEYQSKLLDLDGKGHGFNEVVFENGHKWQGWEGDWGGLTKSQKAATVKWLSNKGVRVRGHTLVWPGWSNSPADLKNNASDLSYLKNRINNHIDDILDYGNINGTIREWDVINEPTRNVDIANAFKGSSGYPTGREIYVDIFEKVEQLSPQVKKFVNEANYTNFYTNNEVYKSYVQEMVNGGATIDGVGFQAHMRYMIPPEELYAYFDEFHQITGGEIKITEYDTKTLAPDSLEAAYFRDLLTIVFSHPHCSGFLMWGFWDGAHYSGRAPLFDMNWNLKKGGKPFIDLVFNKWWTPNFTQLTDQYGEVSLRGFKGKYKITITQGNETFIDTLLIQEDKIVEYKQPFSPITELKDFYGNSIKVYPNPAKDHLTIEQNRVGKCRITFYDIRGKLIKLATGKEKTFHFTTSDLMPGVYIVELENQNGVVREKIIINQ